MIRHSAGDTGWPQCTHFIRLREYLCLYFTRLSWIVHTTHSQTTVGQCDAFNRWAFVNLIISWDRTKRFGATKRLLHPRISHHYPYSASHSTSVRILNLLVRLSYESNTEGRKKRKKRWKLNHMVFVRIEIVLCANISMRFPPVWCLFVFSVEWQRKKIKQTHVMRSTRYQRRHSDMSSNWRRKKSIAREESMRFTTPTYHTSA